MTQQIKLRRDTAANWTGQNTVILGAGEVAYEIDNMGQSTYSNNTPLRFKVGDGLTPWINLPYYMHIIDGSYAGALGPPSTLTQGSNPPAGSAPVPSNTYNYSSMGATPNPTAGTISFGLGAPSNSATVGSNTVQFGNIGDIYIRTDGATGSTIYQRRSGGWSPIL